MKQPSDELFLLIQSLTQSEKRYFKIFSSTHVKGKKNNYVQLFEIIDKQKKYDEQAIIQQFAQASFIKQFAVTKNYLYRFILKSLRAYHAGHDIDSKITEGFESAKILYHKGLYKKCIQLLKKVKKLAHSHQKYEHILNLLDLERDIMYKYLLTDDLQNYLQDSRKESKKVLDIIKDKYELRMLEYESSRLYRNYTMARSDDELKKYETILQHPLVKGEPSKLPFDAQWSYHNIYGVYYTVQEDYENAAKCDERLLQLFENNALYRANNIGKYIRVLNNLIYSYTELKKYAEFQEILLKIRCIPQYYTVSLTQQSLIFETTYFRELSYFFNTRQFQKGLQMVPAIEKGLAKFGDMMLVEFKASLLFLISKLYFYTNHLQEARSWAEKITFEEEPTSADDMICYARILILLIHYDLGNKQFLESEIINTKRFLKKKNRLYKVETEVLRYLTKLVKAKSTSKKQQLFMDFKEKLNYLMTLPYEQRASSFLNVTNWLDSKIQQKTMLAVMKPSFEN